MTQLFEDNIKILAALYNDSKYKDDIIKAIKASEDAKQKIEQMEKTSFGFKMCNDFACEYICLAEAIQINGILLSLLKR